MFGVDKDFKGRQVFIVTGLSGAGKTSLMRALEDSGFYCVDNLPLPLLSAFLNLMFQSQTNLAKVALGIDARGQKFLNNFISEIERTRKQNTQDIVFKIIFLNSSEDVLVKRFQETRRNHPLVEANTSLLAAIRKEREVLEPIRHMADVILNTDIFNVHELRRWVRTFFTNEAEREVLVNVISFGFKFGVPAESNLVYDLRFLPNPYFEPTLKAFDGRNELIQNYLFSNPDVNEYWAKMEDFLKYSIQKFYQEGRFFVHVAIGCTGGKHRSVAFAEKLCKQKWDKAKFLVQHRDLGKE